MKIIYTCPTGVNTSLLAACLHLGASRDIYNGWGSLLGEISYFSREVWQPVWRGRDEAGHEVYTLGVGSQAEVISRTVACLIEVFDIPNSTLLLVDVSRHNNLRIRLGGLLTRGLRLRAPGRFFLIQGAEAVRPELDRLVTAVKEESQRRSTPGTVKANRLSASHPAFNLITPPARLS